MTQETDFDPTARLLADTLNTEPPPDVEARMRERLDALRIRIESPAVQLAGGISKPRRWVIGATALAALSAVVLFGIILFPLGSSQALAQIAEAVAAKKWLHAKGTGPDGKPAEMWFSAKNGILGSRTGESFVFVDQVHGTMDVFGEPAAPGAVHRLPLENVPSTGLDTARQSFLSLLSGDLRQAMKAGDQQVLEHKTKSIRVEGRDLVEHRFVVGRKGQEAARSESLLQVDPKTNLPVSWQMKLGDKPLFDFQVSYPEHGPLTITALGAPESAKLVDGSPPVAFQRVLVATTTARRRFDNYHAVVVEAFHLNRARKWDEVYRIWRKGDLWRVDRCQGNFADHDEKDVADGKKWWLAQVRTMKSYPREIWDGKKIWTFEPQYANPRQQDPADSNFPLIASLKGTSVDHTDRKDPLSRMHMLEIPEFYGYEHLNRGAQLGFRAETRQVELDKQPMTLVDIIKTANVTPKSTSPQRYWLDPQRGNLMVRKEQFLISKPDESAGASEVLSASRTPQGLWYPTAVRLIGNSVSIEDNTRSDTYVRYYLEFDAEIPDELFQAEAVDEKDFWTKAK
ncbi:MAG: hypothetical protein K8R36_18680 [Planctomycetales bacterium]|nr:hypothetical protein [Planctomycetales bacterium]